MDALNSLSTVLPAQQILRDKDSLEKYGKDWTKHIQTNASAIVFPKSTKEVQALVLWARKNKIALIPSGGRTGLSGAAFATKGEVVVSFERMNHILDFNEFDHSVTCEPGVITEQLQKFAEDKGLCYPVDFASRGSSQIGGNIATNAGGIKVLRYGLTRNWVAGLEVVTGTGDILSLNKGLIKNATGYDLRQLFIGSEGTLGFITQATMTLTRPPENPSVFLFAVPELDAVMKIYHAYKSKLPLLAFEMFTETCMKYVLKSTGLHRPFETPGPYFVLLELEGNSESLLAKAMDLFESSTEKDWIIDGTLSQSPQQAKDFWRFREDISESTSPYMPYKNDISVRVSRVPQFLIEMDNILRKEYPDFEICWFGHIGDGNLHVNILKPANWEKTQFLDKCKHVDEILFKMIERFEGSISAEHGVGLTKKPFLHHSRSLSEIKIMRDLKKVFDPDGILNPGKIFDL